MNFSNLAFAFNVIGEITNGIEPGWLSGVIKGLIDWCGNIGLGIIVFTLILKLISLPFDIFSRVSTKKNAVMMEKIRPELEKLQRQYANDKQRYQLKLQELYKKNGYSPFSACLPTILNLVFFIIVIGQFSTYSNFANFQVFCEMSKSYNQAVVAYDDTHSTDYMDVVTKKNEETGSDEQVYILKVKNFLNSGNDIAKEYLSFGFNNEFVSETEVNATFGDVTNEKLGKIYEEMAKGEKGIYGSQYAVDEGGYISKSEDGKYTASAKFNDEIKNKVAKETLVSFNERFISEVIKKDGRLAAAETFRNTDLRFLWVKNVWSQDLPWQHPIKENFKDYGFVSNTGCCASCKGEAIPMTITDEQYKELTAELKKEKSQPNGFLILVVLSIGTMLLSQIIMQKQNKTQMELSSVDGENGTAAMSQKMMTWMMPIMFGVFSFMYTASFSIYIVVSSIFSLASTLLINWLVEKRFERLALIDVLKDELKRTGRLKEIGKNKKLTTEEKELLNSAIKSAREEAKKNKLAEKEFKKQEKAKLLEEKKQNKLKVKELNEIGKNTQVQKNSNEKANKEQVKSGNKGKKKGK